MLHRAMSEPKWTTAQQAEAERLVDAVERELSAALYGAPITPVPRNEVVGVSREGMVSTALPVAAVVSLNGVAVDAAPEGGVQVLPTGYTLRNHYLWRDDVSSGARTYDLQWLYEYRQPAGSALPYTGLSVAVQYLGGWGAEPSLVEAILRKAKIRMSGAHSDTVVITGLNSAPANGQPRESPNFGDDDMKALGRFRALGW